MVEEEDDNEFPIAFQLRRAILMVLCGISIIMVILFAVFAFLSFKDLFESQGPKTRALNWTIGLCVANSLADFAAIFGAYLAKVYSMVMVTIMMTGMTLAIIYASLTKGYVWAAFVFDLLITLLAIAMVQDLYLFNDKLSKTRPDHVTFPASQSGKGPRGQILNVKDL